MYSLDLPGDLGVGSAEVVRSHLIGDAPLEAISQPTVVRGRDPVQRRIVVGDEGSRSLENFPECYRPVADRQRGRAERGDQLDQCLRGERMREEQRSVELGGLVYSPARGEHLTAAR